MREIRPAGAAAKKLASTDPTSASGGARSITAAGIEPDRSTKTSGKRGTDGIGATFSFAVRERICDAHVSMHAILRQRVVAVGPRYSGGSQGQAASYEGMVAELKEVSRARRYQEEGLGPQRTVRGEDVRRALLELAATCVLLAERADRPDDVEARRGEKAKAARQWYTPAFDLAA